MTSRVLFLDAGKSGSFLCGAWGHAGRHGEEVNRCGPQIGGAEHDLLRLLDDAGLPKPVQVETVPVRYASHFRLVGFE